MQINKVIWRHGILFVSAAIVGCLSISRPEILAGNKFVKSFMGPDFVSVLVVIVSVTFASVANVHLAISRLLSGSRNGSEAEEKAKIARNELNSNAWALFWALVVALGALFAYGQSMDVQIQSWASSVCIIVLVFNGIVVHDIYSSVFILVANGGHSSGREDQPSF